MCWVRTRPQQEPTRVTVPNWERCCGCGALTISGIYLREEPEALKCRGVDGRHLPEEATTEANDE
jgi:hypothetical protein